MPPLEDVPEGERDTINAPNTISVQIHVSKAASDLLILQPGLFPKGEAFKQTIERLWEAHIGKLKASRKRFSKKRSNGKLDYLYAQHRHYLEELSYSKEAANIDIDKITEEKSSADKVGDAAPILLTPPLCEDFVFVIMWPKEHKANFKEKFVVKRNYEMDHNLSSGTAILVYHQILRLWGNHKDAPPMLNEEQVKAAFTKTEKELVGNQALRDIHRRVFSYFTIPRSEQAGIIPPRSLLLYGPPGTGKTTLARELLKSAGVYTIWLGESSITSAEKRQS